MSWSAPDEGFSFRVKVFVVDDTYWDDGNRTTSRLRDFKLLAEALAYKASVVKKGRFTTTSGHTGKEFTKHVDDDDVCVYRWLTGAKPRPKWAQLFNDDAVSLLGELA